MASFYYILKFINDKIIWGTPMLVLLIFTGIYFSIKIKFRNITGIWEVSKNTLFSEKVETAGESDKETISPFQTLAASLGATLGTGNIAAVGAAIAVGGAGAVFWMWVSALLGMATCYAENYLGIKYREKGSKGTFSYIEAACGTRIPACTYAVLCIFASIGAGNMAQINTMSESIQSAFGIAPEITGLISAGVVALLIFGGLKRIGKAAEKVIPLLSIIYILASLVIICVNIKKIPECFAEIIISAFDLRSVSGGILGSTCIRSMSWGFKRGVFSNEAGMGSSVMFHSSSAESDPQRQGQWAMLQVFIDTIIMCTLTALVILLTGAENVANDGINNAAAAFSTVFGRFSSPFIAVMLTFFAITTAAGWSVCGLKCFNYLTGNKCGWVYLIVYTAAVYFGACARLELVWELADLFNGLMILPNVYSLLMLSGSVSYDTERSVLRIKQADG